MAITLSKRLEYSIGSIVTASIQSAKNIKMKDAAKVEADFQQAIADGTMSYEAQLEFRKIQLNDENNSSLVDQDVIDSLNISIKNLKRINTFQRYRDKYTASYIALQSGKINVKDQLSFLKQQLKSTTDQELRSEIQGQIAEAEGAVVKYNNTILDNRIQKAQKDGTKKVLSDTIKLVSDKKANALINNSEEEVSYYDIQILSLRSQLSTVTVSDKLNDIEMESDLKNLNANEKLKLIQDEVSNADPNIPVKIGDTNYDSVQEFWSERQGKYLSGNGSGQFSDFFAESSADYVKDINNAKATIGTVYPAMDKIKLETQNMSQRPDMQEYTDRINNLQNETLSFAFNTVSAEILDKAQYTSSFKETEANLMQIANRYGLDTEVERMRLGQLVEQKATELESKALQAKALQEQGLGSPENTEDALKQYSTFIEQQGEVSPSEKFKPTPISTEPLIPYGEFVKRGDAIFSKAGKGYKTEEDLAKDLGIKKEDIDWGKIQSEEQTQQKISVKPTVVEPVKQVSPTKKTIIVKQGETLSQIAKREYGDANRWKELKTTEGKSFNEETAKQLQVGTKLTL